MATPRQYWINTEQQISKPWERIYVDKGYQVTGFEPRNRVFKSDKAWGDGRDQKFDAAARGPIIGHLESGSPSGSQLSERCTG